MPKLKPWYHVVTPREDLCQGRPLDAAEFAVHLDNVRLGTAPADYKDPRLFFRRTYLTANLTQLGTQVLRRLAGLTTETSAVFNLSTQFGGGKTHALTMLYHLAKNGPAASAWQGVEKLLAEAAVQAVPAANVAVFVGTEFDSLTGRGGEHGEPRRKTPWGEIAWQVGGAAAFKLVADHEAQMVAPGGDVINAMLPPDRPCLILIDELMNYIGRFRKLGLAAQTYNFLQGLGEVARGRDNVVLAVSVPKSEMEMTVEDQGDFDRIKKMLDRLGKAITMSAEDEASEIIRRRLFEWDDGVLDAHGRAILPKEAHLVCAEYGDWMLEHRQQLPTWFPVDQGRDKFIAAYPFHPALLSVFQRKWQSLPRFQQTRGILRLLALWVSRSYQEGVKGQHKDALIGMGTAPLDDSMFRTALFEQLGELKLEGPVTTDIIGDKGAHAARLDQEATEAIKKARLHRKVATAVFFESNGGQTARTEATVPDLRLAVSEPDLDIGNLDTVLEGLTEHCYYLTAARNKYRFSQSPNLNKILADRRANVAGKEITTRVQEVVQKEFGAVPGCERVFFPEKSNQVLDRPLLTLVVLAPDEASELPETAARIEQMTREAGTAGRTFKSALVWAAAGDDALLREEARKALAWEQIEEENGELHLDDAQLHQLAESLKKAQRDLREAVWRTYRHLWLLGKDNKLRQVDLGQVHSSSASSLTTLIINRLKADDELVEGVSANLLVRNWPAMTTWSTKAVRDAFFSSPRLPRLLNPNAVKDCISKGVVAGLLGYVGLGTDGRYEPFYFNAPLQSADVEITDGMYVITAETARAYLKKMEAAAAGSGEQAGRTAAVTEKSSTSYDHKATTATVIGVAEKGGSELFPNPPGEPTTAVRLSWRGEITTQKWMQFYTKVLTKHVNHKGLKLTVKVDLQPDGGLSKQAVDEIKSALRELGLSDLVDVE